MNPKASLFIGTICISFSPIFVKLAVAPPLTSGFYRVFIAWVLLAPCCLYKKQFGINRKDLIVALIGGIVFGADMAIWNLSLTKISATISTLLANLAPLWVGLLSYFLFRKKSGVLFWIGTWMAIAGMIVLVGYTNILHLKFNIGTIYALIASLFYAFYIMITKGSLRSLSTLTFMFYSLLAAAVFLLISCESQHNELIHFSAKTWLCFLGMGIVCQLVGWITINYSLSHLESTKVSIVLLSQTALAAFWAMVILGEKLDFKEIIGSIIILAGIAVTFLKRAETNKATN